jgi:beta-lactamase regulating signal transducer with metallopeptidase domain
MAMSTEVLQWLWSVSLATAVVTAILLILPRLLRRRFGAGVAYAAWGLFPIVVIVSVLPGRGEAIATTSTMLQPVVVQIQSVAKPVAQAPAVVSDASMLWLLCWLAGAIAMVAWLWRHQHRFVRDIGALRLIEGDLWQAQAREGLPALLGVLRTRIVLPEDFDRRYDEDQRRLMLAHERLHRRRGDHLANLLVAVVRCLFWFNPLVHLAAKSFRHDQELACDEAVIAAHPDSRRAYGEAMLNTLMADRLAPLGCHWGVSHPLKERMMQLKSSPPRVWTRRIGAVAVAILTLGAGFAAWSSKLSPSPSFAAEKGANDGVYFAINLIGPDQSPSDASAVTGWLTPGNGSIPIEIAQDDANGNIIKSKQKYSLERNPYGGMILTVKLASVLPVLGEDVVSQEQTVHLEVSEEQPAEIQRPVGTDGDRLVIRASMAKSGPCPGDPGGVRLPNVNGQVRDFRCLKAKPSVAQK